MTSIIQHIAIATQDPEAAAEFYCRALGLRRIGDTDTSLARGVFVSDGHVNIALLRYNTDEAAGHPQGTRFQGLHHIGFAVESLAAARAKAVEAGALVERDLPRDESTLYAEVKLRDGGGVMFDISERGWITGPSAGGGAVATPPPGQVTVETLDAFLDAWNAHDVDRILSFMTDDCVFEASFGSEPWGQRYQGQAEVRQGIQFIFASVPDIHWQKSRHFIDAPDGVSEWTVTGTRTDGSTMHTLGCDLFTFRDGKIASKRAYRKTPR